MKQLVKILLMGLLTSFLIAFLSCNELEENTITPTVLVQTSYVEVTPTSLTFEVELTDADSWKYICMKSSETTPTLDSIVTDGILGEGAEVVVENLESSTLYKIYVVAISGTDNYSKIGTASGTTLMGAPVVTLGATEITSKTLEFKIALDFPAVWKYMVKPSSEEAPTVESVKTDGAKGEGISLETIVKIEELTPETAYKLYVVATSALGLDSELIILEATTSALGAPSVRVLNTAQTHSSLTFEVTGDSAPWKYICQKKGVAAPDAAKVVAKGTDGVGTSVTVESLDQGTEYIIYIVATSPSGINSAMISAEGRTSAPPTATVVLSVDPGKPSTARSLSYDVAFSDADSWKFLHKLATDPDPEAATVVTTGAVGNGNGVTVSGLAPLTAYKIYVVASKGGVNSEVATVTATTTAIIPIAKITDTTIEKTSITYTVELTDATSFKYIHQLADIATPTVDAVAAATTGTSPLTISSLSPSTEYKLYVVALDTDVNKGDLVIEKTMTKGLADYYTMWQEGKTFTIGDPANGGITVNKSSSPYRDAQLIDPSAIDAALFTGGGLVFVNNLNTSAQLGTTGTPCSIAKDLVLVGRYELPTQATINVTGEIRCQAAIVAFKNIKFVGLPTLKQRAQFNSTGVKAGTPPKLIIDDCHIENMDHMFYDSHKTLSFGSIYVNNSTLKATTTKQIIHISTSKEVAMPNLKSIILTNNIIYSPTPVISQILNLGANATLIYKTENLVLTITNNTVYNLNSGNALIRTPTAAKLDVSRNVCYFNSTNDQKVFLVATPVTTFTNGIVKENYLYTESVTATNYWKLFHSGKITAENTANYIGSTAQTSPFSSVNAASGYFPINRTVVTNGAGANYTNKPWITQ